MEVFMQQPEKGKNACKGEMECFSRVVGFYRPTKLWNKGKKSEFDQRLEYSLSKMEVKNNEQSNDAIS